MAHEVVVTPADDGSLHSRGWVRALAAYRFGAHLSVTLYQHSQNHEGGVHRFDWEGALPLPLGGELGCGALAYHAIYSEEKVTGIHGHIQTENSTVNI